MGLFVYEDFLKDLLTAGDATFPRRVLSKVIDQNAQFINAKINDHEYEGIENAWIRYVSSGGAAFRVIYIRRGADVFLYRAGPHSVEDNLSKPRDSAAVIPISEVEQSLRSKNLKEENTRIEVGFLGRFYENNRPDYIRTRLLSRRFTRHKSITLVSPYLTKGLLSVYSPIGKVLHDLRQEGTSVLLITRPPESLDDLRFFERLETEQMQVMFHETVHAKLYIFEVDPSWDISEKETKSLALIGSANLTASGIAIGETNDAVKTPNEELVYELPEAQIPQALDYATYLCVNSWDIPKQRAILTANRARNKQRH